MVSKKESSYQGSVQDYVTIFYLNRITVLETCNLDENHYYQF